MAAPGHPPVVGRRVVGDVGGVEPEALESHGQIGDPHAGHQFGPGVDAVHRQSDGDLDPVQTTSRSQADARSSIAGVTP